MSELRRISNRDKVRLFPRGNTKDSFIFFIPMNVIKKRRELHFFLLERTLYTVRFVQIVVEHL